MTPARASLLLDVGSSAIKALVVGSESGEVLASRSAPAPSVTARGARRELDPRALEQVAHEVAAGAITQSRVAPSEVIVSTQMHTAVLTDAANRPLSPMISWQDNRLLERDRTGRTHLDVLFARGEGIWTTSGIARRPGFGAGNLGVWLREQTSGVPNGVPAGRVHTVGSYLAAVWGAAFSTGVGNAASLGVMDVEKRSWSSGLQELHGLENWELPEIIDAQWAHASGDIVTLGGVEMQWLGDVADHQASVLGAGDVVTSDLLISLGTAGIAARRSPRAAHDVELDSRPFGDDYLLARSRQPGGAAAARFAQTLAGLAAEVAGRPVSAQDVWARADALKTCASSGSSRSDTSAWVSFSEGPSGEPEVSFGGVREPEAAFSELYAAFVAAYVEAYRACSDTLFGSHERPERLRFNGGMAANNAGFVEALRAGLGVSEVEIPSGDLALQGLRRLVVEGDEWKGSTR